MISSVGQSRGIYQSRGRVGPGERLPSRRWLSSKWPPSLAGSGCLPPAGLHSCLDLSEIVYRPQRVRMLLAQDAAARRQHLLLKLPRPRQIALRVQRQARLFIAVSVSGCSSPSTRRLAASTCSSSFRAPARSPCARSVRARLFIAVSVPGCSSPSTRRRAASTCWFLCPAKYP